MLKKDYIKPFLIITILILIIYNIIYSTIVIKQYKEYRVELNKLASTTINRIIKEYPDEEEKIINQIVNNEIDKDTEDILKKYGMDSNEILISSSAEKKMQESIKVNIMFSCCLGVILLVSFLLYMNFKERKINSIVKHIKQIEKNDYSVKIEENTEGELSRLQNEVYKITVMLKEQADNLKREKKSLADSLADISHQLKTPLTSIMVIADVLKENEDMPNSERQDFIKEISRQLDWINWLVISLLKLSRFDAGTIVLKSEEVDLKKLLYEVKQNLSIPLDIKNQKLEIFGGDGITFVGDFNWTKEAITNIVKNCIEHTDENKKIVVSYDSNVLYTQIKIKDEGIGISKEDLPHIFTRFYKGKNAEKESVGIGLALSKIIIDKQGGDISVKSSENEGSEFTINFYRK